MNTIADAKAKFREDEIRLESECVEFVTKTIGPIALQEAEDQYWDFDSRSVRLTYAGHHPIYMKFPEARLCFFVFDHKRYDKFGEALIAAEKKPLLYSHILEPIIGVPIGILIGLAIAKYILGWI